MITQEIRRKFLDYFKKKGHAIIASSSVVPHDDPTLLFTNAGMNQFKDVFLGHAARDYRLAATSQKCIRVGGKHNDLDNVGHTSRHLTFFEMMGNFSFGGYFKEEAIAFSWEVATEVFGFDPQKIWPTVFRDDDQAFEIWKKYVPVERITRRGEKDNFWEMGNTGPCGPCSELHYDRGDAYGPAQTIEEDATGERYLEFWNLVFMQYNRAADGQLTPLPKPSIDTGAGLERVIGLKMGANTLFETDVLRGLIRKVEEISGIAYDVNDPKSAAFRVIADHLRCLSFAIADGAQPSNVDRGYVLRKVLRRAVRYGRTLGFEDPFLARVLPALIEMMGSDYPELVKSQKLIADILTIEEEAFFKTLKRGGNMLTSIIAKGKISGDDAFKLKDTYGFPLEEILLIAHDANVEVDTVRFEELEKEARERSRSAHKSNQQIASKNLFEGSPPTQFTGYHAIRGEGKVAKIVVEGAFVSDLQAGQEGIILLDTSPFYAEMGGQIGDIGALTKGNAQFVVTATQAPFRGIIAHVGVLKEGRLKVGDLVLAEVDSERRQKIANNHTATHLLHWALHCVLGEHVKQAGSVVDSERLRFDFSHHKALTTQEMEQIEDLINEKIRHNDPVHDYVIPYEDAMKQQTIKQFFGEKYGSEVRVIDIHYSKELCGGTHTRATGTIGFFKIAKESSIAAGIRRIEALTGGEATQLAREGEKKLEALATLLKTTPQKLDERLEKLLEENRLQTQQLKEFKQRQLVDLAKTLAESKQTFKSIPAVVAHLNHVDDLRSLAEEILNKIGSGVIVLGTSQEDRVQLIARVSQDLVDKGIGAHELLKEVAPIVEGSGGGKAAQAQAGGKSPHKLPEALEKARVWITSRG